MTYSRHRIAWAWYQMVASENCNAFHIYFIFQYQTQLWIGSEPVGTYRIVQQWQVASQVHRTHTQEGPGIRIFGLMWISVI